MPENLQRHLQELRDQLAQNPPMSADERARLASLIQDLELQLARDAGGVPDDSLVDGINLAVERFEVEHPTLAATLRNILQSLVSMGI
ncbi:DUF4404 family protein [Azotobacter chroococcum]|uniref:DUF4404 family protein n=1 Tax=Azotobacter chroococcum TaxID=353 RepID=A0AAQ0BXE4_9GAMM|nr:DUF4404 family protein [Azotobacter chroococcum]QQE87327.1 DUF4404 family protein [Azotobacter chroococcum]TKD35347.1 DUF4404 family protein [Azotobacter chroococcum]